MSPELLATRLAALLPGAATSTSYGGTVVEVGPDRWVTAVTVVRDEPDLACTFFDLLTAVDELAAGFVVVVHLWSTRHRHGVELRTRCPREDPQVPSLTGVFGGADWHERHAAEMFDLVFTGHPGLTQLLLPPGFDGHPLRKDFVLASRVIKPWPGAKEPGESDADLAGGDVTGGDVTGADVTGGEASPGERTRRRRRQRPPGVPDDWRRS